MLTGSEQTIVGQFTSAALGLGDWQCAAQTLAHGFGCTHFNIEAVDAHSMQILAVPASTLRAEDVDDYVAHIGPANPRIRLHRETPAGAVLIDAMVHAGDRADGALFYDWLHRSYGVREYAGLQLHHDGNVIMCMAMQRQTRRGDWDGDALASLVHLMPHLQRTVEAALALGFARAQTPPGADIEASHAPIALLSPHGYVLRCNAAMDRLLAEGDGIALHAGQLRFPKRREQDGFDRALGQALAARMQGEAPPGPVVLHRPSGARPYRAVLLPLAGETPDRLAALLDHVLPAAMLILIDPESRDGPPPALLRAAYGLSPSEALLAHWLATGQSIPAIAARLGASQGTVRSHLSRLYARTETRDAAELVAQLARWPRAPGGSKSEGS